MKLLREVSFVHAFAGGMIIFVKYRPTFTLGASVTVSPPREPASPADQSEKASQDPPSVVGLSLSRSVHACV